MSNPKHIVIDARPLGSSGFGSYLKGLLEGLGEIDQTNRYSVLSPSTFDHSELSLPPNFSFVPTDYPITGSLKEQFNLAWKLYRLHPDLVHFGIAQQPLLYFGRTVTTVHDLTPLRFKNPSSNWFIFKIKQLFFGIIVFSAAHKSKALITPSAFVQQDLAKFAKVRPSKITVTYEAATKNNLAPQIVPSLKDQKYVLFVGRPNPHKNLARLIGSMQMVKDKHPEVVLVLAGKKDTNYERLKYLAKENNLTGQVIFTGYVTDAELRWLYEHALAYVFPSLSEGFGLPGLEAMLYSLPVLSSNATCLPEIYKDAALYFDPLNINDMAQKIIEVIENSKLSSSLATRGQKVAQSYSWHKMAQQTHQLYLKLLS